MPDETPDETPDGIGPGKPAVDERSDEAGDETGDEPDVEQGDGADESPLPEDVVDEAERLTRLARDVVDEAEAEAYREARDDLLASRDYTARVREDDTRDVLVVHPEEWVEAGTIRPDRIDDLDRGIERPLSGPGEGDDWAEIDAHNRELVEAVREEHGDVHAANAAALADFMGNHYARPIESATRAELEEFLTEYYPRNGFATDEQAAVVEKSVSLVFAVADERCPIEPSR